MTKLRYNKKYEILIKDFITIRVKIKIRFILLLIYKSKVLLNS